MWLARGKVQEVGSKPKTCCSFPPRSGVDAARGRSCASPGAAWLEATAAHTAPAQGRHGPGPSGPSGLSEPRSVTRHLQQHPPHTAAALRRLQRCLPCSHPKNHLGDTGQVGTQQGVHNSTDSAVHNTGVVPAALPAPQEPRGAGHGSTTGLGPISSQTAPKRSFESLVSA